MATALMDTFLFIETPPLLFFPDSLAWPIVMVNYKDSLVRFLDLRLYPKTLVDVRSGGRMGEMDLKDQSNSPKGGE